MSKQLIHVSCCLKEAPLKEENGVITLSAESWRNTDMEDSAWIKVTMNVDLYLDILSDCREFECSYLVFIIEEDWELLKELFLKNESLSFFIKDEFALLKEEENQLSIVKRY